MRSTTSQTESQAAGAAVSAPLSPTLPPIPRPVVVDAHINGEAAAPPPIAEVHDARSRTSPTAARVRVLVVTWNRKEMVERILRSLSRQRYAPAMMDVTVIDNASTDGTLEHLSGLFTPERLVLNDTDQAHRPRFRVVKDTETKNRLGFGSLTIIRNRANVGGCGGFNTGFAYTEWLSEREGGLRPDYLWLVDDDADVSPDTLLHLAHAMESDPAVGLVGSRTVNIADRRTTIETTIYYNWWTGAMQDDCPPESPKYAQWRAWVKRAGGTRGEREFTGTVDVDVVSACSMLARWEAVVGTDEQPGVGFWDWRYFIYCDDADWCLRFAKAGWRVVLSLDAVVYHTPWNLKLTPARIYYANRNKVWMGQKVLRGAQLRQVTRKAMWSILKDSLKAAMHRRLFHAQIILDTARDIAIGRAGKTGSDGPPAEPIAEAMRRLGLLREGARVAVIANQADSMRWLESLQAHVRDELMAMPPEARAGLGEPRWIVMARNDVPGHEGADVVYGPRRTSRLKKQFHAWRARPDGVVVFEQTNDLPILLRGGWNLHIDLKKPTVAQVERDGWAARLRFIGRWIPAAARCTLYALTIRPYQRTGKYG